MANYIIAPLPAFNLFGAGSMNAFLKERIPLFSALSAEIAPSGNPVGSLAGAYGQKTATASISTSISGVKSLFTLISVRATSVKSYVSLAFSVPAIRSGIRATSQFTT